jgi:hypothetical protein
MLVELRCPRCHIIQYGEWLRTYEAARHELLPELPYALGSDGQQQCELPDSEEWMATQQVEQLVLALHPA